MQLIQSVHRIKQQKNKNKNVLNMLSAFLFMHGTPEIGCNSASIRYISTFDLF